MKNARQRKILELVEQYDIDTQETLIQKLLADYEELKKARERFETDRATLSVKLVEIEHRIEEIGAARANMDVKRNDALDKKQEIEDATTSLIILINEIRKDIETEERLREESKQRLNSFSDAMNRQNDRVEELKARVTEYKRLQVENRRKYEDGSKRLEALNKKRSEVEAGNSEFEAKLAQVNAKIKDKRQYKENIFKEYTRLENKLA